MRILTSFLIVLVAVFPLVTSQASEVKVSGFVVGEIRGFVTSPQFSNQLSGIQLSLAIQPEFRSRINNGDEKITFVPFIRLDSSDDSRTHADIREMYWLHNSQEWTLLVGVNRIFWGVVESNNLVDIINQTDLVEDIDGKEKLGQPMINIATQQDWGNLGFFIMPWFRERTFPSEDGRLRSQVVVARDATYESTSEQKHIDLALRYSHYIGDWDFGVSFFKGTGREPRFILNGSGTQLVAQYDQVDQFGTDIQFTNDAWLWKFEGIARSQNGKNFTAIVGGFEYTFYQVANNKTDLGLLLEYMSDSREQDPTEIPPTEFDDDIFLATRLAMNDTQDTELLAGVLIDRNNSSKILSIEAKRRLNNHWNFELEGRWFLNVKENTSLSPLKKDSFVTLRLARYF